jgi:peptidoglycan/LPS O-acetylase OafA/YrhL
MERIRELDGLRAIAILLVVAWHYLGTSGSPWLWRTFIFGRIGVDLFFVLSGYLITSILLTNREAPRYFSSFYGRRAFRILPIYAVMVVIYLVGRTLGGSASILFDGSLPWWSYVVGLQNVWMAVNQTYGASWLAGTWSLAIEEQFYLLFPLVVWCVPSVILPRLLLGLLVLCPIGRIMSCALGDGFGYYVLMPLRADILAVGALIAWLDMSHSVTSRTRRVARIVLWVTLGLFPLFAFLIGRHTDFHMALWGHTYLVALFGSGVFTVLQSRGSPELAFLRTELAKFFARISYALYLIHGNVLVLTFLAFGATRSPETWKGATLTALAFLISILICTVSYRFVESPLIALAHSKFRFDEKPQS